MAANRTGGLPVGRRLIKRNGRIVAASHTTRYDSWARAACVPIALTSRFFARAAAMRLLSGSVFAIPLIIGANVARAQSITPLVAPTLDPDYNRGRNISVNEAYEPSFQPLGLRLGSVVAFPSIGAVTGVTSNVYANNNLKRSDAFYSLQPAVRVVTDLPVHQFEVTATADIQRYAHETLRNQNPYFVSGEGRFDFGSNWQVTGRVQYGRSAESPFASDLASDVSVLSEVTRANPSVTAVYKGGRARLTAKVERIDLRFSTITFTDGSSRNQRERDRTVDRGSVQAEYGVSPSIAVFAQGNYEDTTYPALRSNPAVDRGSKSGSVLGGFNFDLAGLMRGTIGAGYVKRDYVAPIYKNGDGFFWQIQTEFFISPLTTLGIGAQRLVQDSNQGNNGAYRDIRATVAVDHALLRNLIVSANLTKLRQELFDTGETSRLIQAGLTTRYQSNRFVSLSAGIQYSRRRSDQSTGVPFDEFRGQVSVRFRR